MVAHELNVSWRHTRLQCFSLQRINLHTARRKQPSRLDFQIVLLKDMFAIITEGGGVVYLSARFFSGHLRDGYCFSLKTALTSDYSCSFFPSPPFTQVGAARFPSGPLWQKGQTKLVSILSCEKHTDKGLKKKDHPPPPAP